MLRIVVRLVHIAHRSSPDNCNHMPQVHCDFIWIIYANILPLPKKLFALKKTWTTTFKMKSLAILITALAVTVLAQSNKNDKYVRGPQLTCCTSF